MSCDSARSRASAELRPSRNRRAIAEGSSRPASAALFIACMSAALIVPASAVSARCTSGYRNSVAARATGTAS